MTKKKTTGKLEAKRFFVNGSKTSKENCQRIRSGERKKEIEKEEKKIERRNKRKRK